MVKAIYKILDANSEPLKTLTLPDPPVYRLQTPSLGPRATSIPQRLYMTPFSETHAGL